MLDRFEETRSRQDACSLVQLLDSKASWSSDL